MTARTCLKCGWVHFGVSRKYAETEIDSFNTFFDKASQDVKDSYGNRRSNIKHYERCFYCSGPYTNFRDAKPGDAPDGVTMQPIIVEHEPV